MCGIAGVFEYAPEAEVSRNLVVRMTDLIAHRGPDDSGHMFRGGVGLGHRRLSIIDLSAAGHQPMGSEDGTIWITYNGECYNYAGLRDWLRGRGHQFRSGSDTEVLLRLYQEKGEGFLADIDGMFAFAIWDERQQTLLVARDRIGIKPLYYFADRDHFLFASEMKALLADPRVPTNVDEAALADYFQLLSIPDPRSILQGVKKLLPGHYLKVSRRGVECRRYWDLAIDPDPSVSLETASAEFRRRFGGAVRSHLVADVPVGAFLSGGVDSSSIVAAASGAQKSPIETFSVTFPGLAEFDESPYAARVAAHCAAHHHEFNLTPDLIEGLPRIAWHADEPFAISSAFALYFLAKLAREHVKVVLSGDGGDEVFAGYPWRHSDYPPIAAPLIAARRMWRALGGFADILPARLRRHLGPTGPRDCRYLRAVSCFQREQLAEFLHPDLAARMTESRHANIVQECLERAPGNDQLDRKLYTDIKTTLVSEMLTKVDRMTMAHGLEARVPFLDHHLVEWAFTVPSCYKLSKGEGKLLVKKAMEKDLPRDILYRPKQGFNVPLKVWMRSELKEFVRDSLAPAQVARRGLYRAESVTALLDDHFSEAADHSNKIFALLMLELWYQRFVDRRAECYAH
jgi:asparagine synthase (glutamine-hydrolysing)